MTKKIPKRIIQNAAGIAVFTCMRNGLWLTGSGGSGILIARKSDGTWSPPSGIMLHTPTLSFIIGVDVYDCVLVVTNLSALESITRPRVTLGEDVALNNGPLSSLESDHVSLSWKNLDHTVLAYVKARGQHQAVNLRGCILTERNNENERFYGANVTQADVLAGNVARHIDETKPLFEVIKMAEGRTDYDKSVVELTAVEPAPGDALIASPRSTNSTPWPSFGIPKSDDPDPFGVLALEMAGLEIREAGTRHRPASGQIEMNPDLRSPTSSRFGRDSMDTFASQSHRASIRSAATVRSQTTDAGTQTDVGTGTTPETSPSPGQSEDGREEKSADLAIQTEKGREIDFTAIDDSAIKYLSPQPSMDRSHAQEQPAIPPRNRPFSFDTTLDTEQERNPRDGPADVKDEEAEYDTNDADDEDDLDDSDEEPVVFEVAQVQPTRTRAVASRAIQAKGSVVTIAKRVPPPLPTKSPARNSRCAQIDPTADIANVRSPLRQAFSEADMRSDDENDQGDATHETLRIETSKSASLEQRLSSSVISPAEGPHPDDVLVRPSKLLNDGSVGNATGTAATRPSLVQGTETDQERRKPCELGHTTQSISEQDDALVRGVAAVTDTASSKDSDSEHSENNDSADESVKTGHEAIDMVNSIANKKHTSSVYTGLTEDRWSIDRSTLTTPTSDRAVSVAEYTTEEDTPKRLAKEEAQAAEKHAHRVGMTKHVRPLPHPATTVV